MPDKYDVYDKYGRKLGTAERVPSAGEQITGLALLLYLFWKPLLILVIILGVITIPLSIKENANQRIEEANRERAWQQVQEFRKQRSQELILALNNEIVTAYRTGDMSGVEKYLLWSDAYYEIANDIAQLSKNNQYRDMRR